jgi:type IV pilus assembly protein PilV
MLTPHQPSRPFASRSRRVRTAQHGAALLEALVAILLLMLGILALIGLQGRMVSASTEAQMRGEATYLADQLIGQMSVDQGNLASYDNTDGSCGTYCTAWVANVTNTLPDGGATVTVTDITADSAQVGVTVNWTLANSTERTVQVSTTIHF